MRELLVIRPGIKFQLYERKRKIAFRLGFIAALAANVFPAVGVAFVTYSQRVAGQDVKMTSFIRAFSEQARCSGKSPWPRVAPGVPGRGVSLLSPLLLLLAACGAEEAPAGRPSASSISVPEPAGSPERPRPGGARDWLEVADSTPPEAWLAAHSHPPADPARLAALLKEADVLFDETPRMLANRTAQLEAMLAGLSVKEPADLLLEGFITLGRGRGRAGYGDLCQHYYNLRVSGLDRAAALAALARPRQKGGTP